MRQIRLILAGLMFFLPFSMVKAQDIILTDSQEIIMAKVLEIGDDAIIYKMADNPSGPNMKIASSRVVKICFENGTEQLFPTGQSVNSQSSGSLLVWHSASESVTLEDGTYLDPADGAMLSRYLNPLEIQEYVRLTKSQKINDAWFTAGYSIIIAGFGVAAIGALNSTEKQLNNLFIVGVAVAGVGSIVTLSAVFPYISTKKSLKSFVNTHNTYNMGRSYTPNIQFGATPNGVALTFNF